MAEKVSLEDLKQIIKDLTEAQQQGEVTRQRLAEQVTDAQRQTEAALKEVAEAQRETEESLKETQTAVKRGQEAVEKQGKNLDKASGNFNNKWGAFMEKLVKGNLIDLLQKQGIAVDAVTRKFEIWDKENKNQLAEFDLLAINGDEMVVVEVKTTLSDEKLVKFIHKLEKYKHRLPADKRKKIYGAVAYLDCVEQSKEKAIKSGLFAIEAPRKDGEFSTIANPEGFEPRKF